jgi:hypothetical protein
MIDPNFDPYEMLMLLQQHIQALQQGQSQLINIITQNREVIQSLHNSNQKNFELALENSRRLDQLTVELITERHKNSP